MIPGKYNIICPQGSTLMKQITYSVNDVPVDLTGWTARMQVREKHTSKTTIISLTTLNGGLTLGGEDGTIDILVDADATEDIVAKEYVYDLELDSGSVVTRLLEGKFMVTPEVTR